MAGRDDQCLDPSAAQFYATSQMLTQYAIYILIFVVVGPMCVGLAVTDPRHNRIALISGAVLCLVAAVLLPASGNSFFSTFLALLLFVFGFYSLGQSLRRHLGKRK